jgi:hypothetical protein
MNSRGPRKSSSECPRLKWENDGGSPVEAHRSSIHKNVPFVTCTGGDRSYTFVCNSLSLCMPFYSYPACDRWDRALILSQPLWFLSQGGVFSSFVWDTLGQNGWSVVNTRDRKMATMAQWPLRISGSTPDPGGNSGGRQVAAGLRMAPKRG